MVCHFCKTTLYANGCGIIDTFLLMNKRKFKVFKDDEDKEHGGTESHYPYVYICPTLYRENKQEMKTLFRSILRLNDDRVETKQKYSAFK